MPVISRLTNLSNQLAAAPVAAAPMSSPMGQKAPDDIVVVSALRTPIGKANKGSFKDTQPDDLLKAVLEATMEKTGVDYKDIGDVVVGNVQLSGAYAGPARMAQLRSGFPIEVRTAHACCSIHLNYLF